MSKLMRGGWVLALGLVLAAPSLAQRPVKPARPEKQKAESYQIVQLESGYQVMKKTEVAGFKKQMDAEHKAATESYKEARKAAAAEKLKFTDPAPKRPQVKVLGKTFKSQADAEAEVKKLEEKERSKKKKSGSSKGS